MFNRPRFHVKYTISSFADGASRRDVKKDRNWSTDQVLKLQNKQLETYKN